MITLKCLNFPATAALNEHVDNHTTKLVKTFEHFISGDVILTLSVDAHHSHLNNAKIQIPVAGKEDIVIEDQGDDMYVLITRITEKALRSVRKIKEKQTSHKVVDKNVFLEEDE